MDPLFSTTIAAFESEEQAASYDRWLRAKVQKSLYDSRPSIPNQQVMAEMKALMAERRIKHEAREALRKEDTAPSG
nr:antitoxin [Pseudomonas fluorescens]